MKIIFLGDIVSRVGRRAVPQIVPQLRREENPDIVIANAENLAGGRGVTEKTLYQMMEAGIDYFTSGNHIFYQAEWEELLNDPHYRLLRPANYPQEVPGKGFEIVDAANGQKLLLINLMGKTFFNSHTTRNVESPFQTLEKILASHSSEVEAILVDCHTEATSEKEALSLYFDGQISAFVGTHTHVPTADCRILPQGTAYVTDVGMIGALNSVLGVKKEIIWDFLRKPYPQRFEWLKEGTARFNSVIIKSVDQSSSKSIYRYDKEIKT